MKIKGKEKVKRATKEEGGKKEKEAEKLRKAEIKKRKEYAAKKQSKTKRFHAKVNKTLVSSYVVPDLLSNSVNQGSRDEDGIQSCEISNMNLLLILETSD